VKSETITLGESNLSEFFALSEHEMNHYYRYKPAINLVSCERVVMCILGLSLLIYVCEWLRIFNLPNSVKYPGTIFVLSLTMPILSFFTKLFIFNFLSDRNKEEVYADINVSNPLALAARFCRMLKPEIPFTYPNNPTDFERMPKVLEILNSPDVLSCDEHPSNACRIRYLIQEAKRRAAQAVKQTN
jgi:hypothetical protein